MSIVACVKVYDGIVLGADSVTQVTGKSSSGDIAVLITYHYIGLNIGKCSCKEQL